MEKLQCSKCKEYKYTSDFTPRTDRPRGYLSQCKKCVSDRNCKRDRDKRKEKRESSERYKLEKSGLQRCTKCKIVKPLEKNNFNLDKRCKTGYSPNCKVCTREASRKTMAKRRENTDTASIVKSHKTKYRKSERGRYKHNERNRIRNHKRRSKVFQWTKSDWEKCKLYFSNKCVYCGSEEFLTQDHFIPLSNDNCTGTIPTNIVPSCVRCNSSKNNKNPYEWASNESLKRIREYFNSIESQG